VSLLGDTQHKVVKDDEYINQNLGTPTFLDVASLGSFAHRPRWFWTNLISTKEFSAVIACIPRLMNRKMDDILDDHRVSLIVTKDDILPFALVNKVGIPRDAQPTFVTYPRFFEYRSRGPCMVWN
jgi:hypothetical protein